MALLKPFPLGRMASRFLHRSHFRTLPFSSTSLSCPSVFLNTRVINRLRRVSDGILIRDAVSPRAFMSSSIITEAFQENSKSKAYGSEQIQVKKIYCHYLSYMTFWSNIRLGERKEPSILQETIISFGVLGSVGPFVKPEKVMPFK